jgi:hypothetical protein
VNRELAAEAAFFKAPSRAKAFAAGPYPRTWEALELAAAALRTGSSDPGWSCGSGTQACGLQLSSFRGQRNEQVLLALAQQATYRFAGARSLLSPIGSGFERWRVRHTRNCRKSSMWPRNGSSPGSAGRQPHRWTHPCDLMRSLIVRSHSGPSTTP